METREDVSDQDFHFPDELLLEILVKLPAKSIFRFKCVSRNWHCLITDPSFLRSYVSQWSDSLPFMLVFRCGRSIRTQCFESGKKSLPNLCPKFDQILRLEIEASANDLILYRSNSRDPVYSVANPFTGQSVRLPMHSRRRCNALTGLVSHVKNEFTHYNVVQVVKDSANILNVEAYSSRTGKWMNFEVRNDISSLEFDSRPCIVFNGTLHWICNKMTAMLAYDPCTSPDSFTLMSVPNQAYYMNGKNTILGVSGGRLYYFEMSGICIHNRKLPGWKLWRMEDYGSREWSLECKANEREIEWMSAVRVVLSMHSPVLPVAFDPENEGIVYFWCENYVLRFDVKTGWFEHEFFGLSPGRTDSTVDIFSLSIPFCPTHLHPTSLTI